MLHLFKTSLAKREEEERDKEQLQELNAKRMERINGNNGGHAGKSRRPHRYHTRSLTSGNEGALNPLKLSPRFKIYFTTYFKIISIKIKAYNIFFHFTTSNQLNTVVLMLYDPYTYHHSLLFWPFLVPLGRRFRVRLPTSVGRR